MNDMPSFDEVCAVVADVLGIDPRSRSWMPGSELFGSVPELDSLAVVEVLAALEERFGIAVEADDLSVDAFETFGSLHDFVVRSRGAVVGDEVAGR